MRKILTTGGCGFIGSNFLLSMVARHQDCLFLNLDALTYSADPWHLSSLRHRPNYKFVHADISDRKQVAEIFEGFEPDWIIHLAAESHVDRSIVGPDQFIQTNIVGTHNLLDAARRSWVKPSSEKLFLHISTDEVYGSLGAEGQFLETSRYDPSSPYSASKAASDHLVRAYHRTYGLPIKITNCSNNYGPRQFPEKLIPLMICNAIERQPLPVYGDGLNVRDWLYVEDHCECLWMVAEQGQVGETYNIGGNCEKTNLEVVRAVCSCVAELTELAPSELEDLIAFVPDRPGHDRRYAVNSLRVQAETGWKPSESFESGMLKTVQWYLDNSEWVARVRSGDYLRWIEENYGTRVFVRQS